MTMSEPQSLNITKKDGWTAHDDSGVYVTEEVGTDMVPSVTHASTHGIERPVLTLPSAPAHLPDRASPRAGLTFPRHVPPPPVGRPLTHSLDAVRAPASLHGHDVDADRSLSDVDHMHMLFEDSGIHCHSIPEDSEGEEEEAEGDTGYRRATFDLPSSPGYMALTLNSQSSLPVSIPAVHSRLSDPSPAASGGTDSSGSVFTFGGGGQPGALGCHTPPRQSTSHPSRLSPLGGLSLSPVIESILRRKMKNRLSGNFEERSLRVSASLTSPEAADSEFRERANSECGGRPDVQAVRDARMARGRSQSAPSVEATLVIQRQQVGGALRIFGDQFNKDYEKKVPLRSPSRKNVSLRRQVLSCPTQHSLWQNVMGKLP